MSNGRDESAAQLMPSVPVLLRALASYLEVTGESEKFTRHLIAVMLESGQDVEVDETQAALDSGGRPIQI